MRHMTITLCSLPPSASLWVLPLLSSTTFFTQSARRSTSSSRCSTSWECTFWYTVFFLPSFQVRMLRPKLENGSRLLPPFSSLVFWSLHTSATLVPSSPSGWQLHSSLVSSSLISCISPAKDNGEFSTSHSLLRCSSLVLQHFSPILRPHRDGAETPRLFNSTSILTYYTASCLWTSYLSSTTFCTTPSKSTATTLTMTTNGGKSETFTTTEDYWKVHRRFLIRKNNLRE